MQQTITIARHGDQRDEIDADVRGDFAVHEALEADEIRGLGKWGVTHVPTGWNVVWTRTKATALLARREFLALGLDWSFTDPATMTADHKRIGGFIKRKYQGR